MIDHSTLRRIEAATVEAVWRETGCAVHVQVSMHGGGRQGATAIIRSADDPADCLTVRIAARELYAAVPELAACLARRYRTPCYVCELGGVSEVPAATHRVDSDGEEVLICNECVQHLHWPRPPERYQCP